MSLLRRVLDHQLTVRQLTYVATTLAVPYLAVGVVWAFGRHEHLERLTGLDRFFSILGEIVAWPVLVIADVHLT
ncbi:hypothetical protein ACRCUN_33325 [Mycobacterium sp. LTG2003]